MQAIVLDSETTGLDAPEPIEVAWLALGLPDRHPVASDCRRFKPSKPIQLGAMATHHIMDEDLADCPPSSSFALPEGTEFLIGHNVDYDWEVIGKPAVKRICTLALSRTLWPEADSHKLGAMLYLLERQDARHALRSAHSAATDVEICRVILEHIIHKLGEIPDWAALWAASEIARVPKVMTFGKHKGMAIADIPRDYKGWLLKQPDVDPYLVQALRA